MKWQDKKKQRQQSKQPNRIKNQSNPDTDLTDYTDNIRSTNLFGKVKGFCLRVLIFPVYSFLFNLSLSV